MRTPPDSLPSNHRGRWGSRAALWLHSCVAVGVAGTALANAAFDGALGWVEIPIVGALGGLATGLVTMVFAVSAPCRDGRLAIAGVVAAALGSVGCTYEWLARMA